MNLSKTVLPQPATVNWDIHSDRMFSRDRASPIPCDRRESRAKSRETLYPAPPDVPSSMSVGTPIPTSLRGRDSDLSEANVGTEALAERRSCPDTPLKPDAVKID